MRRNYWVKVVWVSLAVLVLSSVLRLASLDDVGVRSGTHTLTSEFVLTGEPSGTGFAPGARVTAVGKLVLAVSPDPPIRVGDSAKILVETVEGELDVPVTLTLSTPENSSIEFSSSASTIHFDPSTGDLSGEPIVFESKSAGNKLIVVQVKEVRSHPLVKSPRATFATLPIEFVNATSPVDILDLGLRITQILASIIGLPALIMFLIKRREEQKTKKKSKIILPEGPRLKR